MADRDSGASSLALLIIQVVAAIPPGRVTTYGQIARLAGYPGYARQVGATLRNLPPDTTLPWHRVINAQGRPAFPPGSDAFREQKQRLQDEGVVFQGDRVSLKRFGWQP